MELIERRSRSLSFSFTPLIDLVFLLLIFFMLTTSFVQYTGIPLSISVAEQQAAEKAVKQDWVITVHGRSDFQYRNSSYSREGILELLRRNIGLPEAATLYLKAGKNATVQEMVSTLNWLTQQGYRNVLLVKS